MQTENTTGTESPQLPDPPTTLVVDFNVEMQTRDGVTLRADVYRPSVPGAWPAIVQRNPYDRSDAGMGSMRIVDPAWLARQGFAVIVQDTRGRAGSDGDWEGFHQDVEDGYDCIEWVAQQPWCNGEVGMYGTSGMGITTYKAIASQPPHLKAAIAFVSAPDLDTRSPGGPMQVSFMTWYGLAMGLVTAQRLPDQALAGALTQKILASMATLSASWDTLPLTEVDGISDPSATPHWHDWVALEPGDARRTPGASLSKNPTLGDVALLQVGGYRDFIGAGQFALAEAQGSNPHHHMIAGPWTHRGVYSGATGARELPETSSPAGPLGWGPVLAAWFDIHLRGGDGSAFPLGLAWLTGDPIRYYIEGENRWASAPSWPPVGQTREWLLTSDGDARSASGNGRLVTAGTTVNGDGSDTFSADPHDPFPTCGGALGAPFQGPDGIQDQRAVDHRQDVLIYTSEPLESPITVAGAPELLIHLESTAPDADIHVKLVDVEPDGFAYNVAEGVQRTRYRDGGQRSWLTPGTPTEIRVRLHDTAHTFRPGHRVRVMIAGADYPQFSRNLHTTTVPELGTLAEAVAADHTVHHGPARPSRLIVREIPTEQQ